MDTSGKGGTGLFTLLTMSSTTYLVYAYATFWIILCDNFYLLFLRMSYIYAIPFNLIGTILVAGCGWQRSDTS